MDEFLKNIFIPFEIKDQYSGLAKSSGILKFDNGCLVCEFRTKDTILGILKSSIKEIRIPVQDLLSVEYKKKMFGDKIFIRTKSMEYISYFPGLDSNEICLKINKQSRDFAQRLSSGVTLMISEYNLKNIES